MARVLSCRMFAPGPGASLHVQINTMDGKQDTVICVAVALDAAKAQLESAVEAAVVAYCASAGIAKPAKGELLVVGEPTWRVV